MGLFNLFGNKQERLQKLTERGAVILDVRSPQEYQNGHIEGSKLIPLPELANRSQEVVDWNKPVICCCQSGVRSGKAAAHLRKLGVEAINGGGWQSLQQKL